ncbi:unnamed protein product [Schistosoma curassoni]|uniref:RNase H domain-containing protein n=1 Tax=Schistosoma curassoni TaxID=6186 RepID=A0A183K0F9_9TREM|nr:unnamed protein product [Schistosoma curassoni]
MRISWTKDHQSLLQNKERGHFNEHHPGEKTISVAADSTPVGINIHKRKRNNIRNNTTYTNQIALDGEAFEDVKHFTYIGSIVDEHGGSDADMKARINKARAAYLPLKKKWNSKQLSISQHQYQNLQCKCQNSSVVWFGNLENYESHHP